MQLFELDQLSGFSIREAIVKPIICYKCDVINDTLIGQRLDEYRLDNLLGHGGTARVYRGLDVRLKRWVAVKVIDRPFRADQGYTRRFEREAQAIAQLEHPNIVRVYRYGEADGLLYMVLQYIEGLALDQLLASYRADGVFIEPEEASRIIRQLGSALDYAHSRGVIHRDVKPSNIILNQRGNAILVDFGLALLADIETRDEAFGTPHYISPEQVKSTFKVVPQSDLYALGIILYEMFTGKVPFEAENPLDVAVFHLVEPPLPPREIRADLAPALERVILKALAKEPEARYPTGLALANVLDQALRLTSTVRSVSPPPNLSRLSIPERVRVGLAEHPLPPLPATSSELLVELVETVPGSRRLGPMDAPAPVPAPEVIAWDAPVSNFGGKVSDMRRRSPGPKPPSFGSKAAQAATSPEKVNKTGDGAGTNFPTSVSQYWSIYVGVIVGLAILTALMIGMVLMIVLWQLRDSGIDQGETPTPSSLEAPP